MSFLPERPKKKFGNTEYKRISYLELTPGNHVIRLLESSPKVFDSHWINGTSIKCLGDDCPICQNNYRLIREDRSKEKAFKKAKDWCPSTARYFINVYDRTVVKTCPECGYDNTKAGTSFPTSCGKCNASLVETVASPSNKVKVLSRGIRLFEQFETYSQNVQDETGEPKPITSYDYVLIVSPTSDPKLLPQEGKNDVVNVDKESLFDLTSPLITLSVEEIAEFKRGVALKDIFVARKVDLEPVEDITVVEKSKEATANVKQMIMDILGE